MKEYIEREAVLNRCGWYNTFDGKSICAVRKDEISTLPAADVVERKRGRWVGTHDGWYYSYSCSECGAEALTKEETMHDQVCSPFCPYCGADMRGVEYG